jgi:hypothetical protein
MAFRRDERQTWDRFKFALMCRYPDKLIHIKFDKPEWINLLVLTCISLAKNAKFSMRKLR